jgi:hypothetical protein
MAALRDRAARRAVRLYRTDTMDTELTDAKLEKRGHLLDRSAQFVEHQGPLVWGHSRWDHAVWGTKDDEARIDRVFSLLHPKGSRAKARRQ